jgi:uncharacterized protein YkvS
MNAKDTVMSPQKRASIIHKNGTSKIGSVHIVCKKVTEAQAEISFKAGIKEVVDWINNNSTKETCEYDNNYLLQRFNAKEWQAKLKEWGWAFKNI